ncbi:DMT family transporter [Nocardioides coralli]|nr:DMT family transporter [Nocardioides coralli]
MAVALALASAAAYGLSDFVGGVFSKRTSPWTIALVGQVTGALAVLALTAVTDGTVTSRDLQWAAVAGVGNGLGTAFLYRGLATGRMGVVAPVSGVGAALLPVAVGLLAGERPPLLVWVGILAALPGIWLVAREPRTDAAGGSPLGSGLLDGVLAGLGFGALFAALAQIPDEAGFLPLSVNQLVGAAVVVVVATTLRTPWLPREPAAAAGIATGLLGATATGAFMVASQTGLLTVTAVLASLYPAVTVLLAAWLLREHIHRPQAVGLVLCGVAVALVASG